MRLLILLTFYAISSNINKVLCDSNFESSSSKTINFLDAKGDFQILRTQIDDRLFIDKSLLIQDVVFWFGDPVTTFSRPSKFGKSVNLNMLEKFFKIPDDVNEAQINRKLFFGGEVEVNGKRKTLSKLVITNYETIIDNHFGEHPVISLSFKNTNFTNIYEADQSMVKKIIDFYRQRKHLRKCLKQKGTDLFDDYDRSYHRNCKTDTYLKSLAEFMCKCYKRKVIILIDDYNYAINEAFLKYGPETKELKRMFAFYNDIISSIHPHNNTNVQKLLLTSSMLIDPNDKIYNTASIWHFAYSTYFGFTEDEVDRLMIKFPPQFSKQDDIKKFYGQYKSYTKEIMYNTESILKCLKDNGTLNIHWQTYNNLKILDQILITSPIVGEIHRLIREKDYPRRIYGVYKYVNWDLFTLRSESIYTYLLHAGYLIIDDNDKIHKPNLEAILILERKIYEWIVTKMKLNETDYLLEHLTQLNLHDFHQQVEDILQKAIIKRLYSAEQKYYADVLESLITHGIEYQRFNKYDSSNLSERTDLLFVHTSRKRCASGVMMAIQMAEENNTNSLTVSAAQGLLAIDKKSYHDELLKKNPHIQFILKLSISYRDGLVGMKCQIEKTNINGPNTCDGIRIDQGSSTNEIQITSTPATSYQIEHNEKSSYIPSTTTITKSKKSRPRASIIMKPAVTTSKTDHLKIFIKSKLPAVTDSVLHDLEKQLHGSKHNRDVFERYLSSKGIVNNLNRTIYHLRAAIIHSKIQNVKKRPSIKSLASFSERYEHIINAVVDVLHHSYKDAGDKSTLKKVQSAFEELNLYGESSRTTKANTEETSEFNSESTSHESDSDHSISSLESHKSSEETDWEHSSADDGNDKSSSHSSIASDANDTSDTERNLSESSDEEEQSSG